MGLATLYNYAPTAPVQITRENYNAVGGGDNIVGNIRRAFKSNTDFEIWNAAVLGTQLVDGVDYELRDLDNVLTNDAGYDVYSAYKILNVAYQACNLYITYKIVMSYNDAATDNSIIPKTILTEQGDIIYASAASTPAALHHGNSGDLLSSGGHAANPSWVSEITVTGAIYAMGAAAVPTGFLYCDGSAISRTTYSKLFAIISTTWGVGDGATTFNVPDLRGVFLRGTGSHGTLTKAGGGAFAGPAIAASSNDMLQNITGSLTPQSNTGLLYANGSASGAFTGGTNRANTLGGIVAASKDLNFDASLSTNARTGDQTQPVNIGIKYLIKY